MIIGGIYSFNGGNEYISNKYPKLLKEVMDIIGSVDASQHKTKESAEKTSAGKLFFSPPSLNKAFSAEFSAEGWVKKKEYCEYPTQFYTQGYSPKPIIKRSQRPYREMDFVKGTLEFDPIRRGSLISIWCCIVP